ncbi:MAG: S8 family serine peptidase [Sedimentisphaerales bacterium]|nr:S8 family serine peptidase [Sedimentisphaerales bacterium]
MKALQLISSILRTAIPVLIMVLMMCTPGFALSGDKTTGDQRIESAVHDELQNNKGEPVYVVVLLEESPAAKATRTLAKNQQAVKDVQRSVLQKLSLDEFAVVHIYDNFASMTGYVNQAGLAKLAADLHVRSVGLDVGGHGHLSVSVPFIGADQVHTELTQGYTGKGITVAVLDTGVDSDHPDLSDNIVAGSYTFLNGSSGPGAEDDHGHGTNVAGIITSKGIVAHPGVAPDANILPIKVSDENNRFEYSSDVAAAVDYVVTHQADYRNLCVINMSLGTDRKFSECPCDNVNITWLQNLKASLDAARDADITIFASTGNQGLTNEISAPACLSAVAAVVAVYDQNLGREPDSGTYNSRFGSSWPSTYDAETYPDLITIFSNRSGRNELAAPGRSIIAPGYGGGISNYTGTSQASAHCAGVAALMNEKAELLGISMSPAQIVQTMKDTGRPTIDPAMTLPNPIRVDALAAVKAIIQPYADTSIIFEDNFETGTIDTAKWPLVNHATVDSVGISEPSGYYSLRLNGHQSGGDSVVSRAIDLSSYSHVTLTYWYQQSGDGESPDDGDDLVIEYDSGSGWVELERQFGSGPDMATFVKRSIDLPAESLHTGFRLRIRSIDSADLTEVYDDWFVDDVELRSTTTDGRLWDLNILVCGAESDNELEDIQQKLQATREFDTVDILNIRNETPSLSDLQAYDAVMVFSNWDYEDSTVLGNVMADYVDSGGGVVCVLFEVAGSDNNRIMQGRWNSEQYYAISRGSIKYGPRATLGTVHNPGHQIMQGVSSFDGGSESFRPQTFVVMPGAVRIADWSDGRPLVVTKMIGSIRRVDLGFYPVSSDVNSNFWDSSSDGVLLMVNALKWVARADSETLMPLPEFSETFSDSALTRGYWFEAPANFRITGLRVPDESSNGRQNVEVVIFDNQTPPPNHPATTNAFVSLARFIDEPCGNILSVNITVSTGDIIGILGAAGTSTMHNSYGPGDFISNIGGHSVTLKRMGMQLNLYENQARNLWQESDSMIGRVEMWYIVD